MRGLLIGLLSFLFYVFFSILFRFSKSWSGGEFLEYYRGDELVKLLLFSKVLFVLSFKSISHWIFDLKIEDRIGLNTVNRYLPVERDFNINIRLLVSLLVTFVSVTFYQLLVIPRQVLELSTLDQHSFYFLESACLLFDGFILLYLKDKHRLNFFELTGFLFFSLVSFSAASFFNFDFTLLAGLFYTVSLSLLAGSQVDLKGRGWTFFILSLFHWLQFRVYDSKHVLSHPSVSQLISTVDATMISSVNSIGSSAVDSSIIASFSSSFETLSLRHGALLTCIIPFSLCWILSMKIQGQNFQVK